MELDGLVLLTGANMAGKSTVLRTACAAALLANCGLRVPAAAAAVPRYDAFMLRSVTGDAPSQGLSSFAVEMAEAQTILGEASARSLVMLDELGTGTEAAAGTAVAAAVLERLAATGCHGVFATHHHDLFRLGLPCLAGGPAAPVQEMAMEIADDAGGRGGDLGSRRPTWRLRPGRCTESLAFTVALDHGVPEPVVARAVSLYRELVDLDAGAEVVADAGEEAEPRRREGEGGAAAETLTPPMTLTLADGGRLLKQAAAGGLRGRAGRGAAGEEELRWVFVGAGAFPPAMAAGRSCVYLLQVRAAVWRRLKPEAGRRTDTASAGSRRRGGSSTAARRTTCPGACVGTARRPGRSRCERPRRRRHSLRGLTRCGRRGGTRCSCGCRRGRGRARRGRSSAGRSRASAPPGSRCGRRTTAPTATSPTDRSHRRTAQPNDRTWRLSIRCNEN